MNYRLKLSPRFISQKRELLAQKTIPALELPSVIESCLNSKQEFPSGLGRLWFESLKAVKPYLIRSTWICVLTAFFATGATLSAMQLLKPEQKVGSLLLFAGLYFVANFFGQLGSYFNNRLRNWVHLATEGFLVNLISRKLLRLSSRAAARQSLGNLKVLITSDTHHVSEFMDNVVRNLIPALVLLLAVVPLLIRFTGTAGLAGIGIMILYLPIALGLNQVSSYFQKKGQGALDLLASLLGEWVKNVRLVRYLSWDEVFQGEVTQRLRRYISFSTATHLMACLTFGLSASWWMVATGGVFLVARWTGVALDLLGFFGSLWLMTFLAGYFVHLPNTIRLFGEAAPSMRRIARLLSEEEQKDLLENDAELPRILELPKRVIFENVSFKYDRGGSAAAPAVIRNLSVTLELDQKVAIIGEIASGKTTFLGLLCGEFPPTEGRILIEFEDGTRRNLWTQSCYAAYRKHLAWVPQQPFVSCDPLSANISLLSSSDEAALVEAAYWAELEADIGLFSRGIHEEVGEGGVNLSGGQKQRLNLARAYFSGRAYLVLDDALSAVDTRTEKALMKRLQEQSKGFVLVTHRTAELMRVQEVMVMKAGSFIERGKPEVLAADPSTQFSQVLRAYHDEVIDG